MADLNGFDNFSESRNIAAPRPGDTQGRSPRELPTREQAIEEYQVMQNDVNRAEGHSAIPSVGSKTRYPKAAAVVGATALQSGFATPVRSSPK